MTNLSAAWRWGWAVLGLVLAASPGPAAEADTTPARLLAAAFDSGRAIALEGYGIGWNKPLVLLRVGDAMRLHGLRGEALAALRESCQSNAKVTVDECRDQIAIELCRLLVLAGRTAEAEALMPSVKFRNYFLPARFVSARTALEMGDAAAAEALLRHPTLLTPDADGKGGGDIWRRAGVRIAIQSGRIELARRLIAATTTPLWKSAALGDLAVAHAKAGRGAEALKTVAAAPDAYMAVIGLARVADATARRGAAEPLDGVLEAIRRAAAKVTNLTERDYALGVAVSRLAAAGRRDAAARLGERIEGPVARVRAQCEVLSVERLSAVEKALAACPVADRPLLEEFVAISCARQGMASAALDATERMGRPWQRCRAQAMASRALAELGRRTEAASLARAAAKSAASVEPAPWQVHAHVRAALEAERAGLGPLADQQLGLARAALARITEPELQPGLVAVVAEALAALHRGPALVEFAAKVLKVEAPAEVRARLLPALAAAGETDMVMAECNRQKSRDWGVFRVVAYRLAQHGALAQARSLAEKMTGWRRVEALAEIALAQAPPVARRPASERAVGVSLNGGWASWFPRLERMGVPWELMPLSEPYELGAAGLAAKYAAVGYPGGGGHAVYMGLPGIENVRDYLYRGGGYLGICAGQYLATEQHYLECESLGMGCPSGSPHQVQMRKSQLVGLGLPDVITIARRNGGILVPRPGCEVLGWYDTIERYAALVAQDYGYGRVVALSPHPEGAGGMDARDRLCINALDWVMRGLP